MLTLFNELLAATMLAFRQPIETYIDLETADDPNTLVSGDGSLVSFVKLHGSRQIIGDEEYRWIVDQATVKLGSRFDRVGYAMQIYFMRDASMIQREIDRCMRGNRSAARAIELQLSDLLDERRTNLARYMAHEEVYLVLWTRPAALSPNDLKVALKQRADKKWVMSPNAQFPMQALEALRTRHRSYVTSVIASLEEIAMKASVTEVHQALAQVRTSIYPTAGHDQWRANLPGDPLMPRTAQGNNKKDASDILWPPIRRQICTGDAQTISSTIVRVGDLLWGGVDMTLAPSEPSPFPQLLSRLIDSEVPFRLSFLVESAGAQGAKFLSGMAGILTFTNQINKQIRESLKSLIVLSQSQPVVKLRISISTYTHNNERKLIETRLSALTQALESWGYCQASSAGGDPLQTVMSSALGVACASTAPASIAPFHEVVKLLPWQRACSPFADGAVLFRTEDGRMWPYQMGTTLTTTWFDLIFAQPGSGKSVLMNALNLGAIGKRGTSPLPRQ